mmetsp:Transcript_1032/g.2196  ORF Transcript_1032/g.2196 Transcript_1032/m.2196 type:complete len:92 (+) Transcript_1032:240-515(+)
MIGSVREVEQVEHADELDGREHPQPKQRGGGVPQFSERLGGPRDLAPSRTPAASAAGIINHCVKAAEAAPSMGPPASMAPPCPPCCPPGKG